MKPKVKNVCFTLDEQIHPLVAAKAAELGLTVSAMAKALVSRIKTSDTCETLIENTQQNDKRIKIAVALEEKKSIANHAQKNNWSMSRECRFRIVSSMSATSKLLPEELQKIKGLRSAIDTVGRNIRHMMFNKKLEVNDPSCMAEIKKLNDLTAHAIKKIIELETAATDRWGFNRRGMKSTYPS